MLGRMSCTSGSSENSGILGTIARAITRLARPSVPKLSGVNASWRKICGRVVRGSENSSASVRRWVGGLASSAAALGVPVLKGDAAPMASTRRARSPSRSGS
jgi:hypothetical protein